ncbi:thrombospondin type-1 domain-containing protein 7A-like, partial [Diaphorina citri]|uniref:Thrombospondin type-1 domain-containing protein 7A-like n=1 Tax=Diaphorina citri TaxID=121845 RepID=A0A3Q0JLZ7_DIACI
MVKQWKPCPAVPCYEWQTTTWSSCQLHGATCGFGLTYRNVTCVRGDNKKPVEHLCARESRLSFCKDQPVPYAASKWCYIDCPVDCELSKWDDWNESECTCNQT